MPNPPIPRSIASASRAELDDLTLIVHEGALPADVQGHVFLAAPVGTVSSGDMRFPYRPSFLNGDGMIYRFDLSGARVGLTTRLARSADFYVDRASHADPRYARYRFEDLGMLRMNLRLGARNMLNTAFLPMAGQGGALDRLFVTFDAGRMHEIDTQSLETVTPVGFNDEWHAASMDDLPFKPVFTTAHPVYDARTREVFTVNFGRSAANFAGTVPLMRGLESLPDVIERALSVLANTIDAGGLLARLVDGVTSLLRRLRVLLFQSAGPMPSVTYLVRWDGEGELERWRLVLPDGEPVVIQQTMHQLHVSEDYVVVMDTALKIGLDQALNAPFTDNPAIERLFRLFVTLPQMAETVLYIVPRAALTAGQRPRQGGEPVDVIARKTVLPLEAAHFLGDYANPDGDITLHVGHMPATDVSEWVRFYDEGYFSGEPSPADVQGLFSVGAMDIGRLGRYVIDGERGIVKESHVASVDPHTWVLALYAAKGVPAHAEAPERLPHLFWVSSGFFEELLTRFVYDLYADYPHRLFTLEQIQDIPSQGDRPATLFRYDTDTLQIADSWIFADSVMASSPQFIPRAGGDPEDPLDGYVFCTIYTMERNEIWIFDAARLGDGPVCKLHHPELDVTLTIHTAWLPAVAPREAPYAVDPREDFGPAIHDALLRELFERHVYPHF